jgi:hypothetical protein
MNTLKKDIVVKNSVKPRTYMDYETGRLFYETSLLVQGGMVNGCWIDLPDDVYEKIIKYYYQNYVVKKPPHLNYPNGLIAFPSQLYNIRNKFKRRNLEGVSMCGCMTKKVELCKSSVNPNVGRITVYKRTDPNYKLRTPKHNLLVLDENEFRELATIHSIISIYSNYLIENSCEIKIKFKCCGRHELHRCFHDNVSGIGLDKYLEWNGIKFRNGYVCRTDKKLTY